MQRIRLTYAKLEDIRYTSNLDMQKVWERALRRARIALAYSQGFHPQPRIQQASPLPLGCLSRQEIIDFWVDSECSLEQIQQAIQPVLPPGIQLMDLQSIALEAPTLQKMVRSSLYHIQFLEETDRELLGAAINQLLQAATLPRERRGKAYDLRPLIEEISVCDEMDGRPCLLVRLASREGATGRPDEFLLALGCDPFSTRIERLEIIFESIP